MIVATIFGNFCKKGSFLFQQLVTLFTIVDY